MSEYMDECDCCGLIHFKSDNTKFYRLNKDGPRMGLTDDGRLMFFVRDIGLTPEQGNEKSMGEQLWLLEKAVGLSIKEIEKRLRELQESE